MSNWYNSQFAFDATGYTPSTTYLQINSMPLRSLVVGNDAVSDAVASRLGNANGTPMAWTPSTTALTRTYAFGDWVTDNGRSYVCILSHTASKLADSPTNRPGYNDGTNPAGVNPAATPFWAGAQLAAPTAAQIAAKVGMPGLPFTRQPVKTPINTAPFEQLYLAFAQVMTDSVGYDAATTGGSTPTTAGTKDWQPPMQPLATVDDPTNKAAYPHPEQQMPMFRSVLRDPSGGNARRLTSSQMLKLRAALAAVNTIDLRDGDDDVTSRRVILSDDSVNPPVAKFDVEVFGGEAQPFIGAIYAHVDAVTAANNFIAIQLVNPYDHAITIDPAKGWKLGLVDRTGLVTTSSLAAELTMADVTATLGLASAITVPAKSTTAAGLGKPGLAVIYSATAAPTGFTIPTAGTDPAVNVYMLTGLEKALVSTANGGNPGELYLMRPRLASGPSQRLNTADPYKGIDSTTAKFAEQYDESANISDLVPVDQVDLTNVDALAAGTGGATAGDFYYRRGTDPTASTGRAGWNFVYPGPYIPPNPNGTTPVTYAEQFPQGFARTAAAPAANPPVYPAMGVWYGYDSTATTASATPGGTATAAAVNAPDYTGVANPLAPAPTFLTFPIVWNNTYMAGPNRLTPTNGSGTTPVAQPVPPQFPFGGFARNGDMLQVPFVGAYRVRSIATDGTPVAGFLEMNSVSEDSSLAEDVVNPVSTYGNGTLNSAPVSPTNPYAAPLVPLTATSVTDSPKAAPSDTPLTPFAEQIGRFCPVGNPGTGSANTAPTTATQATYDFLEPGGAVIGFSPQLHWHYHWAKRLFDYLTVENPSEDYFPNVDPTPADGAITGTTGNAVVAKYDPIANTPTGVANVSPGLTNAYTAGTSEDTVGSEGLININTAPWPVLASLPWVPLTTDKIDYTTAGGATASAGAAGVPDRIDIAKAIVDDRNAHGPFESISDLYRVQAIRLENDAILASSTTSGTGATATTTYTYTPPTATDGVFSPNGLTNVTTPPPPTGRPQYDFQDRFILLNRVSNLITTRSDTFTCYVLLQGYRDVGVVGRTPTLVVQRRQAYLIDRNGVTPQNRTPTKYLVPNN